MHYVLKCEHGVMQGQCRCPSNDKAVRRTKNCSCPPGTPKEGEAQQAEPEPHLKPVPQPEPEPKSEPEPQRRLEERYRVERVDGRDAPGQKHHGDRLFVLDVNHDPHALPALAAYIASVEDHQPGLATDLRVWLEEVRTFEDLYRVEAEGGIAILVNNLTGSPMFHPVGGFVIEDQGHMLASIINALAEAEVRRHPAQTQEEEPDGTD